MKRAVYVSRRAGKRAAMERQGFDLVTELKALRNDEAKRLAKAEYAFNQVETAMQAVIARQARKVVAP